MTSKERHTALLEYMTEHGKTEVSTLAEYLHTSKVTIRKDLDTLSGRGIIKRRARLCCTKRSRGISITVWLFITITSRRLHSLPHHL